MVTSFSSKSELGLTLSTSGQYVTFMGYGAPVDSTDVSNSNTPGVVDPTNPDTASDYRDVARIGSDGSFQFTETNAYSGNNGRVAVLNDAPGAGTLYTSGNAGNGSNPEPGGVVLGAGAQLFAPSNQPESAQTPGQPTPVGNFNITQLGDAADKSAKDDNFRGLALNNNVLYYSKGSGGNGVNTVYFLDTTGSACPNGTGLPAAGAALPTTSTPTYRTSAAALGLTSANPGLTPTNMCVLQGFPTAAAKNATDATDYPFGMWFANPSTLYVADEGAGDDAYSAASGTYTAAASTTAALLKWLFDSTTNQWNLADTIQSGLNLGQPYTPAGYPDGTVTVWAETSTVSGGGDQGADPNQLVSITDQVGSTSLPTSESFTTVVPAANATVIRGVSFTAGTGATPPPSTPEVPWAPLLPLSALLLGAGVVFWRKDRRKRHNAADA